MKPSKVNLVIGLLGLCALMVFSLSIDAYAFPAKNIPILLYHKVDVQTPSTYWVSTTNFRDQMFLLHDLGYETVDFNDLYVHVKGITELPSKPVIVSFDDAYQNAHTHAFPILNELTDPGFFGALSCGPTDFIADDELNRLDNSWDRPAEPFAYHLIWPEVSELYNAGWGVEAHSQAHLNMNDAGYNMAREVNSCDVIAAKAGIPKPKFYLYPFNQSSAALIAALKAKGYLGGVDATGGIENTSRLETDANNLFHIRRMQVAREDTLAQFATAIGATLPTIYRLTANINGSGSVQRSPDRPFFYPSNVVTLTAIPAHFYKFDSWSGNLTGSNNPETITMNSDKTVTAAFVFAGFTLLSDGFEAAGAAWDDKWDENGATAWTQENLQKHSGSYSAAAGYNKAGYLTSDTLDAGDADAIYVDFWFRQKNTEDTDFTLSYYNGTSYVDVAELNTLGAYNVWLHYTDVITDSNYFVPNFRIRFDATLGTGENAYVDDVVIKKHTPCLGANLDGIDPVNLKDFAILANDWLLIGPGLAGDITGNELVDFDDLAEIVDSWLSNCNQ